VNPNMQSENSISKTLTQMETCNYQNLKIKIQKKSENFCTIKKKTKNLPKTLKESIFIHPKQLHCMHLKYPQIENKIR
jgi:predicted patatin/cPLA2 family phospholipase